MDFSSLAASPSGFLKLLFGFFASLVPQLKKLYQSTVSLHYLISSILKRQYRGKTMNMKGRVNG